jgi:hypothetical protein
MLRRRLADALREGAASVPELPAGSVPPAERLEAVAAQHLDRTLRQLARHALLEPDAAQDVIA